MIPVRMIICEAQYKLLHDEGKTANSEDKKLSFLVKLELATQTENPWTPATKPCLNSTDNMSHYR